MRNWALRFIALTFSVVIFGLGTAAEAKTLKITAAPSSLSFSAQIGGTVSSARSLTINVDSSRALSFTITTDQSWISMSAKAGIRSKVVQVSANVSGLTARSYTGHILITCRTATNSPLSIPVTLVISPAPPVPPSALAPGITTQPVSQTIMVGQTAAFSVIASGTAPLHYQWNKGGAPISGATATTYTTPATTSADNGASFTVAVSNSVSTVTSNPANLVIVAVLVPITASCSAMSVGQGASLNGFIPFPAGNAWNQDISAAPTDPNSAAIINFIGGSVNVHPDFGAGLYQGSSMGIPYVVANAQQGSVTVNFTAYGSESDPGPMPIAVSDPIEGYPNPGSGDRHVLVLDNSNCWLYELYGASPTASGWNAASAAVWDLTASEQRPYTWTSADAAGLPIFPGLVRYDEVAAGQIKHALRFTLQSSRAAFVAPASHWAANSSSALAAPMGMRLRLKANFDISSFSATNQVILKALKTYGMIMADNGSSMYIGGAPDDRWDNNDLHLLGNVTSSDFEVVQMGPIYTAANFPNGSAPTVTSFTASSQMVSAGTTVTLNWSSTGASYFVVSPEVGAVRGNSVAVTPMQSTTYTLYGTNAFGRTTATINITVH
jgi:hypothetical protein